MHVLDACERQREEICLANLVLQAVLIILDAFKKKKMSRESMSMHLTALKCNFVSSPST